MPGGDKFSPSLLGTTPSFGFGDRLGLATVGHVAALLEAGGPIRGIFSQQSIREMERTARTPADVMSAAATALESVQYTENWGADADHLKTRADVDRTVSAGFCFFTLDPSDHVDQSADRGGLQGQTQRERDHRRSRDLAPRSADLPSRGGYGVAQRVGCPDHPHGRPARRHPHSPRPAVLGSE